MDKNKAIIYSGAAVVIILYALKFLKKAFPDKLKEIPLFNYVLGFLFPALGAFVIWAVLNQYEGFVNDKKYLFFKKILGEFGVKVFYYLLGVGFIFLGIGMFIVARKNN